MKKITKELEKIKRFDHISYPEEVRGSETVREHTLSCIRLASAIIKKYNLDKILDGTAIRQMLFVHDMPEIFTGDISVNEQVIGVKKEDEAQYINRLGLDPYWVDMYHRYESQDCIESIFAKFIDRIQGARHLFSMQKNVTAYDLAISIRRIRPVYQSLGYPLVDILLDEIMFLYNVNQPKINKTQ